MAAYGQTLNLSPGQFSLSIPYSPLIRGIPSAYMFQLLVFQLSPSVLPDFPQPSVCFRGVLSMIYFFQLSPPDNFPIPAPALPRLCPGSAPALPLPSPAGEAGGPGVRAEKIVYNFISRCIIQVLRKNKLIT